MAVAVSWGIGLHTGVQYKQQLAAFARWQNAIAGGLERPRKCFYVCVGPVIRQQQLPASLRYSHHALATVSFHALSLCCFALPQGLQQHLLASHDYFEYSFADERPGLEPEVAIRCRRGGWFGLVV